MRRIYLVARYSRHPEMRQVRDELVSRGYLVTSRWIDQHDGALPDSLDSEALNSEPARAGLFAQVDVDDLAAADTVVSFTSAAAGGRGGRHVEFGIALGLGKRLVVIGPRENVFHTPPTVEQHDSFHGVPRRLGRRLSRSGGVTGEGTVHLLHFARPYRHARHYAGWTHDLAARLAEHRAGRGARLLSVFVDAGIGWELARTWPDSSRTRERALKRQGGASRRCPLCGVRPRLPRECPPGVSRP